MKQPLIIIGVALASVLLLASLFTVKETEYAIKFQLGRIVKSDYEPGLHVKLPFVNNVRKFERRILTLDTQSERMITLDQKFVSVDAFVQWRINDPRQFYVATQGDEERAVARLEDIVRDRTRTQIARRNLVDVVSEERVNVMRDIQQAASNATEDEFGIEVVDVRIKSIELPDDVRDSVFRRMAADRQKVANQYRFEGREQAEEIRATADREAQVILAEAERRGQVMRGEGDAAATEVYAEAYNQDQEFYAFYRSLQAYAGAFRDKGDVLLLDPNSSFFDYFDEDDGDQ